MKLAWKKINEAEWFTMINDIYINIYLSVRMVLFYGLWFTISLFPSKLLNSLTLGKKRNTKSTKTITNTCLFDPPLYMIGKTLLSYCKLSFKYLYFSYGSVLMKEMQK